MGTTNQKNGAADSPERVIALEFQKLGLSGPEVKAYLALLAEGNVSGYQLAKRAGLGAAKVYGLLSRLRERGFVLAADTRPVKYFARDHDEVLQICATTSKPPWAASSSPSRGCIIIRLPTSCRPGP